MVLARVSRQSGPLRHFERIAQGLVGSGSQKVQEADVFFSK
jgi:hypothetical protein